MKLVKESINILKPKDPKKIVEELIDKGSIMDKYAIVVELFSEDWPKLHDEFVERGIDDQDLIDTYISFWSGSSKRSNNEKIHWILSDILQDHVNEITDELMKRAIG